MQKVLKNLAGNDYDGQVGGGVIVTQQATSSKQHHKPKLTHITIKVIPQAPTEVKGR
jgi:hypothetical protein